MTDIKDMAFCLVIAIGISYLGHAINSSFFPFVIDSSLEVLSAVFAINIASTALIAEPIAKVTERKLVIQWTNPNQY